MFHPCLSRFLELHNPRLFQDSSMAFEAFIMGVKSCNILQELFLARSVVDLACFDLSSILNKIASMKTLEKLTIQGDDHT